MSLLEAAAARRQEEQVRDVHLTSVPTGRPSRGLTIEYKCPTCSGRTRNKAGRCRACIIAGLTPDLSFLTNDQLRTMAMNAKAELQRRADVAAALARDAS